MAEKRVFICYDYEKDKNHKDLLLAWDIHGDLDFSFYDTSVEVPVDSSGMVSVAEEAAQQAAEAGISVEVLDLRTLAPFDLDGILASVTKTGRCVIVHEAPRTCGFGAELVALIAERALTSLQAPVLRVTGYDTPFPYTLEHSYLPDPPRVLRAIEHAMAY